MTRVSSSPGAAVSWCAEEVSGSSLAVAATSLLTLMFFGDRRMSFLSLPRGLIIFRLNMQRWRSHVSLRSSLGRAAYDIMEAS